MNIHKKIDRLTQWAGEKMGSESRTTMSEDFKQLETEMALRHDGAERLHHSMSAYVKWLGRRGDSEDKDKSMPICYLGRTMTAHGEDFGMDSEFGNCLLAMGHASERIAGLQDHFAQDITAAWLESLERSLAMMKEYQNARKKLESRRLTYDASISKMQKSKREDFRMEEELRTAKVKYEESSEDVVRRMQDIKDTEPDSVADLTRFLDAELDFHERCADELRHLRRNWPAANAPDAPSPAASYAPLGESGFESPTRRPAGWRRRSSTAHSFTDRLSPSRRQSVSNISIFEVPEHAEDAPREGPRLLARPSVSRMSSTYGRLHNVAAEVLARPPMGRANTYQGSDGEAGSGIGGSIQRRLSRMSMSGSSTPAPQQHGLARPPMATAGPPPNVGALRAGLRPVSSIVGSGYDDRDHVSADHDAYRDHDTAAGSRSSGSGSGSGSGSPEWGERSASPATSYGSLSRNTTGLTQNAGQTGMGGGGAAATGGLRKAPPPPPPSRAKKPPPPVPARREVGY